MKVFNIVWKHIRRSPYQAMAAILTMFVTFLLTGVFFLASTTSFFILRYFESKPQLTVFFNDKATKDEADKLVQTLNSTGKITAIKYVTKDDALAIYKEQNKNDPLLLEMVTADILPASLEISANDPKYLKDLDSIVKTVDSVEEVVYQKDVVDSLISWTNAIRLVGGILAAILVLDSLLVIMTIINMKIALKKDEIEILKLVGASSWYIRSPFILEGGIYGFIGAFFAWFIISFVILWLQPALLTFLGVIPVIGVFLASPASSVFVLTIVGFMGILTLTGFLLGCIGSLIAANRYLKM